MCQTLFYIASKRVEHATKKLKTKTQAFKINPNAVLARKTSTNAPFHHIAASSSWPFPRLVYAFLFCNYFRFLRVPTLLSCLLIPILRRDEFLLTKLLRPKLSSSTGITLSIKPGLSLFFSVWIFIITNFQSACSGDRFRA